MTAARQMDHIAEAAREHASELLAELVRALVESPHTRDCRYEPFEEKTCDCWRRSARRLVAKVRGEK